MANHEINEDQDALTRALRMIETGDPVHADVYNALFSVLINNDVFLEKLANKMIQQAMISHVTDCTNSDMVMGADQGPVFTKLIEKVKEQVDVLNTNQQNTENKVPDIRYGEFSTTSKTKIPITKSTGILILTHRGVAEQTSNGAVYIITAGGARNIVVLNPSGNFKVKNGDGYAYVTSSETYWAYVYVTR